MVEVTEAMLAAKFESVLPHLDERQRRLLLLGAEARALGHGGIGLVARAAGTREATVPAGAEELDAGAEPLGRARRPGGGRKRAADADPGLVPALLALAEPAGRGNPVSPLRWTAKPARVLAAEPISSVPVLRAFLMHLSTPRNHLAITHRAGLLLSMVGTVARDRPVRPRASRHQLRANHGRDLGGEALRPSVQHQGASRRMAYDS